MAQISTRCAFYVRSATASQTEEDPFALQLHALEEYALSKGYGWFSSHIYSEIASTYKDRPRFSALLEAAKNGEFDVLVIRDYDRLTRNQTHLAVILETLNGYGIRVESIIEICTDLRLFSRAVLETIEDIERKRIVQRSAYGRRAARRTNE